MAPIDINVTKRVPFLSKRPTHKNGTSQKWHPTTYIVAKNPGLSLNKPRGHCNIEFGVKGYFLKKFNTFCPSLCTEMETIETALSIRSCIWIQIWFRKTLGNIYIVQKKSQPHPKVCILHSYQIFSRLQKIWEIH